jgi:hypothetical protein
LTTFEASMIASIAAGSASSDTVAPAACSRAGAASNADIIDGSASDHCGVR